MNNSNSTAPSQATTIVVTTAAAGIIVAYACYQYITYDYRWWWKRRSRQKEYEVATSQPDWETSLIFGHTSPGWESVRDEFVHNFRVRGELGAAVCIYYKGEIVVDLWGGFRDRSSKQIWERDTLVPIYSTTKGISAFALQILSSRNKLNIDDKVVEYWPEFGQNNKDNITVRQLIDHSVGLAGIDPPVTLQMLQAEDPNIVLDHIAQAKMEWPNAGDKKGYMAMTLGFYESALVQKTDGRTTGQYLREEAFTPLGIQDELYIGLPDSIPDNRLARIDAMKGGIEMLWPTLTMPDGFISNLILKPNSYTGRAFRNPQLSSLPSPSDFDRRDVRRVEFPAAGGQATARAVATMYWAAERAINTKGSINPLGLTQQVLQEFTKPAQPGKHNGWIDEVIGLECCMGAGLLLPPPPPPQEEGGDEHHHNQNKGRFICIPGSKGSFGTPGAGGSLGYCDPEAEIAFCYLPNRCGMFICDDIREYALRSKMYQVVNQLLKAQGQPMLDLDVVNAPHFLTQRYLDRYPELKPLP